MLGWLVAFLAPCFFIYHYVILNRWGNVVAEAEDHEGIVMWDGTSRSGEECSAGVYFYKISGELYDNTPITKHGNVTLIRSNP